MAELQEYKCPCCGGKIEFNSTVQKMKCPFCDTEFEMDALKAYDDSLNKAEDNTEWASEAGSEWAEGETDGLRTYVCKSCGGEIIGDENTAATSCPYCDNPIVMMGQFSGELKPDYVIPFKYDKNAAINALNEHFKGKKLLPKVFKDQNHIEEIKGIYVPFWLFDVDVDADIHYNATKVKSWEDNDYRYKETSFYSIQRAGSLSFENIPADGSSKMDDTLMESIEPFRFSDAVDFQTAYLAGYLADKYDVNADDTKLRINERIINTTYDKFRSTVNGYDSVEQQSGRIDYTDSSAKYVLCPVWILNTTWNGEKYVFAMNGQTGKLVGDLPLDKAAYYKTMIGSGLISAAAALAVMYFMFH